MKDQKLMSLNLVTSIDLALDEARENPPQAKRAFRLPACISDSCFITIKAAGFAVSTFLMTLGLPLFFFLMLSGWNMDLLFLQVDNLASRYIAADSARQLAFSDELKIGFFGIAALIALWRIPRFVRDMSRVLDTPEQI